MRLARHKVSSARCLSLPASKTFEVDLGIKPRICSLGMIPAWFTSPAFHGEKGKRVAWVLFFPLGRSFPWYLFSSCIGSGLIFLLFLFLADFWRCPSPLCKTTAFSFLLNRLPSKVCYLWPPWDLPRITYCPTREWHEDSIFEEGKFTNLFA